MTQPRIRLLTFRCLPSLTDLQQAEGWAQQYARLSDRMAVFENHYLQNLSTDDPLKILGDRAAWLAIADRIGEEGLQAKTLVVRADETSANDTLPDWLNVRQVVWSAASGSPVPEDEPERLFGSNDLGWLHVDLPMEELTAELFERAIACVGFVSNSADEDVLIVTSIAGSRQQCPEAFETLLFEGRVRVPLWMTSLDGHGQRIQTISGSKDVATTILALLQGGEGAGNCEAESAALPASGHIPRNLGEVIQQPANQPARQVSIEAEGLRAIRDDRFLFVQQQADEDMIDGDPVCALYSKPEDAWNVNDVSGDYPRVVEEFSEGILQSR